ncbi:methyl-accepting chemotaxis protein [Halarcobacter bivalviorum]|uniref:Chemotaxis protein n=1 Tax=Halarcobacter bivalviorum TaxID=663364 RepID=A0AAX2AD41_9BACT|nr:PAS domain-containing methyl-accepting chemotaxis protein [Halarcobacter bivalviorum]AXH12109.1 PAS sensor-containing MCP-domain signal transduction protein [Halarcobacter bivalviorum]RXK11218.1 chemotaxis protein [Halarcobacter bivalviorum]
MSIFISKKQKAQLETINQNFAVISFTPEGVIKEANRAFLDAMGYELNEVVGKHHSIFCDKNYVNSSSYTKFWSDLALGKVNTSEFKRVKKNGESIFIQASYSPVKDSSGKVYEVIKFAQDITEQKLKNLYIQSQIDAISKSQAIIEFDINGIIQTANENFLNTLGYRLEEIVGKHHSIFCEKSYVDSNAYEKFWEKLKRGEFDSGQYKRVSKSGKDIWIMASYNPILDLDGRPYRVIKFATDISERKKMMIQIDKDVNKLGTSLNNLSTTSYSLTQRAKETMTEAQEVSSSVIEVNSSTSEVSQKIQTMQKSIIEISESTQKSKKVADEAQEKTGRIIEAIKKLNNESEKIDETIGMISQIAFQTNILSLNAAVEAATAGEAGKGFAVVAQEVRNLANRSDEATKEITTAIEYIQNLVRESLESITNIDETIKQMNIMSNQISDSMIEQKSLSNDVANLTLQNSDKLNQVTNNISSLSTNAKETDVESNDNLNVSNELIEVSNDLIETLTKLR